VNQLTNASEEDLDPLLSSPEPIRSKPRSTKKIHFGPELTIIPVYRLEEPFIGWVGGYNYKTKKNPNRHYRMGLSNEIGEKEIVDFEEYTASQETKRAMEGFGEWERN
jgi:hypothetical protein